MAGDISPFLHCHKAGLLDSDLYQENKGFSSKESVLKQTNQKTQSHPIHNVRFC